MADCLLINSHRINETSVSKYLLTISRILNITVLPLTWSGYLVGLTLS